MKSEASPKAWNRSSAGFMCRTKLEVRQKPGTKTKIFFLSVFQRIILLVQCTSKMHFLLYPLWSPCSGIVGLKFAIGSVGFCSFSSIFASVFITSQLLLILCRSQNDSFVLEVCWGDAVVAPVKVKVCGGQSGPVGCSTTSPAFLYLLSEPKA